jgi:hypothetical protein
MTEREQERAAIVAWLRKGPLAPASIFSWRDRLFYAWWGLRNPAVSMTAARIAVANAIERGEHIGKE